MSSRRLVLSLVWLDLALAMLVTLIYRGTLLLAAVAGLAWIGGIVSKALVDEFRGREGVRRAA